MSQPAPSTAATRPQPQEGSLWRVLAVVLVATTAGGLILAGFLIAPRFIGKPVQVTDRDRAMLIVAGDFQRWSPQLIVHNDREQITKTRYDDEAVELVYHYDALSKEPSGYVHCEVVVAKDAEAAETQYDARFAAMPIFDRVDRVALNEQFAWGEQSQYGELQRDKNLCGRYFYCRKGNRVYSLVVCGLNTQFAAEFSELLAGPLDRLADYEP